MLLFRTEFSQQSIRNRAQFFGLGDRTLPPNQNALQDFHHAPVRFGIFDGNSQGVPAETAAHRADVAQKKPVSTTASNSGPMASKNASP